VRRVGIAFLAGDRSDIDDAPIAPLQHDRHDRVAAQVNPEEIDHDDRAPFFRRQLPRLFRCSCDAGVVDQDVDFAELSKRGLDPGSDRLKLRDIDYRRVRRALVGQVFHCASQRVAIDVPQAAPRARSQQTLCNGKTDSARCAGHHGAFPCQFDPIHRILYRVVFRCPN